MRFQCKASLISKPAAALSAAGRRAGSSDTRAVLNGVLWILRTGAQWRELPEEYAPYQTVHGRFQQWVRSGQSEKALRALAEKLREDGKLDLEEGFIDGSFASAKKGASQWEKPRGARGPRSWPSRRETGFLWQS
jgi:transposase